LIQLIGRPLLIKNLSWCFADPDVDADIRAGQTETESEMKRNRE